MKSTLNLGRWRLPGRHKTKVRRKVGIILIEVYNPTFWPRFLARLIDGLIFILLSLFGLLIDFFYNDFIFLWFNILIFLYPLYSIYYHLRYGQTIGKKALGIKVISISGQNKLKFIQVVIREGIVWFTMYTIKIVEAIDYFTTNINITFINFISIHATTISLVLMILALVVTFMNKKRRSLYDFLTKTEVIEI